MRISMTTILYAAGELVPAFDDLAAAGADGFELQPHHTGRLLSGVDDRGALAERLAVTGAAVSAVMSGYLHDARTLDANRAAADLAARLGAAHLPVLPPRHGVADEETFVALLRELGDHCAPLGVTIGVHHHAGTIVDVPARIDAFLDALDHPAVGLCFDTAHYALFADDEADAARRYAERISYVHVKDLARRRDELGFVPTTRNAASSFRVPGDGVLELSAAIRALREGGYDGWLSMELENFRRPRAESAAVGANYLRGTLA